MRPFVTTHAARRAVERLEASPRDLHRLFASSLPLSWRRAAQLGIRVPSHKSGVRFRVAGDVLLVCRGAVIITVWRLTLEQLATLLVWSATGWWIGGAQ